MKPLVQSTKFTGNETFERDFDDAILVECTFEDYSLEGGNFMGALFVRCQFKRADFYWAKFFGSKFVDCHLEEVDFRGAALDDAVFIACRLERCDFSRDNLGSYTDITEVTFHDSTQADCKYEKEEGA